MRDDASLLCLKYFLSFERNLEALVSNWRRFKENITIKNKASKKCNGISHPFPSPRLAIAIFLKSDLFVNSFIVISNKLEHGTKYYCVWDLTM